MSGSAHNPWSIREDEFPRNCAIGDQLRFLLQYAVLAPSGHNTQPWVFRIAGDTVEFYSDLSRELRICDPDGRELIMSCGAALFHLRVAMQHFGFWPQIESFPDATDGSLLARVNCMGAPAARMGDDALFAAIPKRHMNRHAFIERAIEPEVLSRLQGAASLESSELLLIESEHKRREAAELIAEADAIQGADVDFRSELSKWLRSNASKEPDGLPGYAMGQGFLASALSPFLVRRMDMGRQQADKDWKLVLGAPAVAILWTKADSPEAWLTSGQALARILLTACSLDLHASVFSGPVELPELRSRLTADFGIAGFPQIMMRFGYGDHVRETPRRPVDAVLAPAGGQQTDSNKGDNG